MTGNTFGHLFRVTTFGESHGPAIGCIVDGVPPRLPLQESDIQHYLDKENRVNRNTQPNAKKVTGCKSFPVFLKA